MAPSKKEQIQKMLESEPNDSFLNYALALEYAKANEIKLAIETLEQFIKRDENYLAAYYQLGKYYELINDIRKAIEVYQKGILIAKTQKNTKTLGELNEALMMLED
jgi:tetratricopeptide (TPR) repeat protein